MAPLGAAWAGTDAFVLATRYDTSGPGGNFNFTNARWWKKYYKTNEAGFWERSLTPYYELKPENRFIVAAVGDSFTFGQGSARRGASLHESAPKSTAANVRAQD